MATIRHWTNQEIVDLIREVSAAKQVKGDNFFAIRAYDNAADAIEHLSDSVEHLYRQGKLADIPGIGVNLQNHLTNLIETGRSTQFDHDKKGLPAGMFILLTIPGIGPKSAYKLAKEFNLNSPATAITKLKVAAQKGKIATIEGFGDKSQADILNALDQQKPKLTRIRIDRATIAANKLMTYFNTCPDIGELSLMGSIRRRSNTVGDIDLGLTTTKPDMVTHYIKKYPDIIKLVASGSDLVRVNVSGNLQIDIKLVPPESWGSLLQHFTGSKAHNIHLRELALTKGVSLSEYGIKTKGKLKRYSSEQEFYQAIGLPWVPPELREDQGEIEAALKHQLPKLIEAKDIHADFHTHTNYDWISSHDSANYSIQDLLDRALELGYHTIGVGDHNPSLSSYTSAQIIVEVKKRSQTIDHISQDAKYQSLHVFKTLEVDIRPDGALALPDQAFDYLDYVVASVHSSFNQPASQLTHRVIKAISHPKVKIIGHPTGRIIGERSGFNLNWEHIFAACREHSVALEINAHPSRLDIDELTARSAITAGVNLAINTDSHQLSDLDNMPYGLDVARRGWSTPASIINTWAWPKLHQFLVNN